MIFSVVFWHTFWGTGADQFGAPTKMWPWEDGTNSLAMAKKEKLDKMASSCSLCRSSALIFFYLMDVVRANFDFIKKIGLDRWCFHDRDITPDDKTLAASLHPLVVSGH